MIDIFCDDNKCPVCGGEMGCSNANKFFDYAYCNKNHCYNIDEGIVFFFNEEKICFSIFKEKEKIVERIKYWKENDRYLAEILMGDK